MTDFAEPPQRSTLLRADLVTALGEVIKRHDIEVTPGRPEDGPALATYTDIAEVVIQEMVDHPEALLRYLCEYLGTGVVMEALHRAGDVKAVQHHHGVKADAVVTAYVPLS